MSKKVFIVSSSPRIHSNSDMLAAEFEKGASSAGHTIEKINLKDLKLQFCIGCMYCQNHDKCVLNDNMNELYKRIQNADVIVFVTPIYYYAVCGQLKTFLDRLNPLYPRKNKFTDIYFIATAADDAKATFDGALKDINGWIDCFENAHLAGSILVGGVDKAGDVAGREELNRAYETGKSI